MDKKAAVPLVCHGHSRPVVDLFYSPITPDGFFLISASKDSHPMLRNGETADWIGTFEGHKGAVWSSCLDNNALRAASASADFSAKLWDALTGDVLHSFEHKHIVRACAFSEDTKRLLTGGFEKILRVFDLNRLDAPPTEVDKSPGSVRTLTWLHSDQTILSSCTDIGGDTKRLLTGGFEKILRVFDLNRLDAPPTEVDKSPGSVRTLTWLHSDQTILSSCTDIGGVRLWDVRSGKIMQTLETKSPVTSAEVSQDGRYITTADGSTVKFWDANHFGLVKSYEMPCNIESASLEPKSGEKFVAGGEDMWVRVFDFYTGEEIGCNKGHHGPVHCVRFSPTGESYASGSEDGTIRIWQTAPNQEENEKRVKHGVDEVAKKIEGFHINNKEAKNSEKPSSDA
ncbi:hypothetical protein DY000_02059441 [Brassica cretica]|uniref:Serine-threonine kinase receptor-associated protein n=1 Tax=Brassica cretica TaxID=69181 RepID=A0ABQ7AYQ8_BRACR|nr:hypothetical protein DY000_02059441 [Brassica cretica]